MSETPSRWGRPGRIARRIRDRHARDGWTGVYAMVRDYVRWRRRGGVLALPVPRPPSGRPAYEDWIRWAADVAPPDELVRNQTRFSIVCPVHDPPAPFLESLLASVTAQSHSNWELILVDDASRDPAVVSLLATWQDRDARIRVLTNEDNMGVTRTTNLGIEAATGDYIVFVDHDDVIGPHALAWLSTATPEAELVYTDEDKIDERGRHHAGFFKPAWSPRLLLAVNYVNHLSAVATDVLREMGGLRDGFDGAQDHDLLLRLADRPLTVAHVPAVLYHWRTWSASTSANASAKRAAEEAGLAALDDAIRRRGWTARAAIGRGFPFNYRVEFAATGERPLVKVVVPTRDRVELLAECIDGLLHRTDGVDLHIVIVDNGSREAETHEYLDSLAGTYTNVTVERVDDAFNYSALCNRGADVGPEAPFLLFVNNDIKVEHRRWLLQLVGWLRDDPDVVAAGPKLMFPDGTLQHGGVVVGIKGIAGHVARGMSDGPRLGYLYDRIHEVQCLTAACLLVRTRAFRAVDGFETALPVDFQDVDLSLKLRTRLGGILVYDPSFPLTHVESASRGTVGASHPYTVARFRFLWGETLERGDPYWSPHFSLDTTEQVLAPVPRRRQELALRMLPRFGRSSGWPTAESRSAARR